MNTYILVACDQLDELFLSQSDMIKVLQLTAGISKSSWVYWSYTVL